MLDKVPALAQSTAAVVYHPHPFASEVLPMTMSAGMTVLDMVNAVGVRPEFMALVRVWVDDLEIPREAWAVTRPRPGRYVYIKTTPGKSGKNILASVLMLLVVVGAAFLAPVLAGALGLTGTALTLGTSLIGGGLTMLGSLLVNALIPPPSNSDGLVGQMALLSGVRNQMRPYAEIPRIFGKRRVYPLLAARPYTEAQGKSRYLRVLLCVGWGPLKISDIKIGDTPIEAFDAIRYQVREGWTDDEFGALPAGKTEDTAQTLFTKQVLEESFNVLLASVNDAAGPWETRRTEEGVSEISIDVAFPIGLVRYDEDGDRKDATVTVDVQYRKVGDTDWIDVEWDGNDEDDGTQTDGKLTCKDNSATPVFRGGRWIVPEVGQYDVRLRRVTEKRGSNFADRAEWVVLRSILRENPVNVKGLALIALRLRATDQLNGMPDTINCVVESYLPVYDGTSWEYQITRNPAWAYADVLRRRATRRILKDTRIDLDRIRSWATACDADAANADEPRWAFDGIFEGGSVMTALQQIGAHGRAAFSMRDGKYSMVRDAPQTVPVQIITPRNSWGYAGSKAFMDLPHALRVSYINAENGYQDDEIIVYADGYSKANASQFERLDLPACTSATQAWREGRYHIAVGQLRPEEHTVNMDIEALRCNAGDLVHLAHDVLSIGLASGRIVAQVINGSGLVSGYVLDETVQFDPSQTYALRTRRAPGGIALEPLMSVSEQIQTNQVALATPVLPGDAADEGDLFVFGEADRETAPMLVKKIEPGGELTARLTLVDAQQGVHSADTGEIPAFETYASTQDPYEQKLPPAPVFTLKSDETMVERLSDGTLQDRIGVLINPFASSSVEVAGVVVEFRETDSAAWIGVAAIDADTRVTHITGVTQGKSYRVRARSVSRAGVASQWVVSAPHIVVGRTTPPANVTGFTAQGRVDGVQLNWTANTEIDIAGYEVRRGSTWDSAAVVARLTDGPSLFASVSVAQSQTFLIRAVDVLGLKSATAAVATAAVVAPADVARFDAYPQGENIRFVWQQVEGAGVTYEIRCGEEWATAQRVSRSSGNTITLAWPVSAAESVKFWIKAVSPAGLYSATARFVTVPRVPSQFRNVVLQQDFSADTWAGAVTDMVIVGTGAGSSLETARDGAGLSREYSEACRIVTRGETLATRCWLALLGAGVAQSPDWADAAYSWNDAGQLLWLGAQVGDDDVDITPYIALDGAGLPSGLIEGFRLDGSLTGVNGTVAGSGVSGAATYEGCRFSAGLAVSGAAAPGYTYAIGSQWFHAFDFKVKTAPTGDFILCELRNGSSYLRLVYIHAGAKLQLQSSTSGQAIDLVVPLEAGDVLTIGISQGAASRSLFVKRFRADTIYSAVAAHAPVAAMTGVALRDTLSLGGSTLALAPAVYGDMETWSAAFDTAQFTAFATDRKPIGYSSWAELVPGDYTFASAAVRIAARVKNPAAQAIIVGAVLNIDMPDVVDAGAASVDIGGTTVSFGRTFTVAPEVTVVQTGGATVAAPRVESVTRTGFVVKLYSVASPASTVAGTISFTAVGY